MDSNDTNREDNGKNIYHSSRGMNNNSNDNNNNTSDDKEAYDKAAHVIGKSASEYNAPGVGARAYNKFSKTPIGKGYEKWASNRIGKDKTLGPLAQGANRVGGLDAADKAVDMATGIDEEDKESSGNSSKESSSSGGRTKSNFSFPNILGNANGEAKGKSAKLSGDVTGNEEDESGRSAFSMVSDFVKKHGLSLSIFSTSLFTFLSTFLIILVVAGGILSIGFLAEDLQRSVSGFFEKAENFVTLNGFVTDEQAAENAKRSFYQKLESVKNFQGVSIDVTLIEVTLFYNQGMDAELNFSITDNDTDQEGDFNATTKFYKEAKKKVKQLAKMQIIKTETESECSDPVKPAVMDSKTNEDLAREYQNKLIGYATKRNKVYYAYEEVEKEDGTTETVCNHSGVSESYSTSIGREGVYYYNLITPRGSGKSFIEKYYADELGDSYSYEDLKEVADDIYDLYEYIKSFRGTSSFASTYASCPNGVTVISGTAGNGHHTNPSAYPIGTFDLEEYVAMVVNGENNSGQIEAMKAQIIAARTYTLVRTNNCANPIRNSTQDQVARANPTDLIKQLVEETAGMVLTYNGNIFSSEYSSFRGSCSGDTCSGVYTKLPNGEKHTVTVPRSFVTNTKGHGRGMTQCGANYLSSQGQTYEQILKYFYSDGVEISKLSGGSSALAVANGTWAEKAAFLFPSGIPRAKSQMSQYLATFPVETVDINGNKVMRTITAHKSLQADLENIFREIAASGFPIHYLSCFEWRGMSGNSSVQSHHSYGVACDINASENPFSKWGAGALKAWQPGINPYSITPDGQVVQSFTNYGWIWGGHWKSSKDYMHFSFSGH